MDLLLPFRHPWVLAFLVIPAGVLIYTWRRRGRSVVLPFDHGMARSGWILRSFLDAFASIPALLLAVAILLLAGPQRWDDPRTQRAMTNIEFCVDVSGSMTSKFEDGTRYDASMSAINDFLDFRKGDAFGLTFFGNAVLHWVPLTSDVSAFRCAPPFMTPGQLPRWFGGTEIGKGLLQCRKVLNERTHGDRMIILVSDGQSADLEGDRDKEIAQRLADDGIVVYAVHIAESEPPAQIVNITSITSGEVFNPGDRAALARVFSHIDQMQQAKIEKVRTQAVDDFAPWCKLGLILLSVTVLAGFGLRYSPW